MFSNMRFMKYATVGFAFFLTACGTAEQGAGEEQASQFEEGVHYTLVGDSVSEEPKITEFFSFYCGTCYQFQAFNNMLEERFPDVTKNKYQLHGITPRGMERIVPQVWAAAEILGVDKEFSRIVFSTHFEERNQSNSLDDFRALIRRVDVSDEEFDRAYNSMQAQSRSRRGYELSQEYNVTGTPTYVINEKYKMELTGFRDSENFFQDFMQLAEYLIEKD